jgi:Flp pilus assembly protein TadD
MRMQNDQEFHMRPDPLVKVRINKRIEQAQESLMAGDNEGARSIYDALLAQYPENALAMRGMGILNVMDGHLEEAEQWLRKATENDPYQHLCWNDLGEALRLLDRVEEAADAYQKALKLQANFVEAMNNLAVVRAGQGNLQEARHWFEQAIEINPEDAYPYNNLGVIYESEGKFDSALHYYEEAVKRSPDLVEAKENYASLLARQPEKLMASMGRLLEDAKHLD